MSIARSAPRFVSRSIVVAAAGLAVAMLSACDKHNAAPTPGVNPRQVTVLGSGQVQGVPDTLTADVGIEFTAPDVTTAMNETNDRQQAVINALVGAGLDRKDISTTEVTLQPQYRNPEPNGTAPITGYRASNAIQIKIHPTDAASRMLALIVNTGGDATRISSVSYSIADDSQLVKDARARAFNDAKNRADQYAQLSGLRLGKVLSISEATGGTPTGGGPPAPPRSMPTAVPLEPGQQTVSFSVTAVWELD
ncbi:MAG TPA: SIMPL domain-containing protein [Mycobacterium sp.]|jgi:hypothetical protein